MTAKLTVRMETDLLEKLREAAARDKRSVNQQIIWYVLHELEREEPDQKKDTA